MTYAIDNNDIANTVYFEWTTEPPTQEGQYWVFYKTMQETECVSVSIKNGNVVTSGAYRDEAITHWLGPLPIPEPPIT